MAERQGAAPAAEPLGAKGVIAIVLGNAIEFYDFTSYAFFATYIGRAYFPSDRPETSLLLALATFGVGFLTRPVGALVIGAYADRVGRRPAMTLTIALMALGTLIVALVPPYAAIGIAAPLLVVGARLIQGFAVGGEVGSSTSYMLEAAPPGRRAEFGSWQSGSQGIANLTAGLLGYTLAHALPPAELESWGWRIPFALGALILPVGLYIRRRLDETLDATKVHGSAARVIGHALGHRPLRLLAAIVAMIGATVGTYISIYMTTYALNSLHMAAAPAMLATVTSGVVGIIFPILGGMTADRWSRRAVMVVPRVLLTLVALPAFLLLDDLRSTVALLSITALLSALNNFATGTLIMQVSESFPQSVRSTAMAAAYAVAVTVFGGTTQYVITWLIDVTGDPLAPAYYLIVTGLPSAVAAWFLRPAD